MYDKKSNDELWRYFRRLLKDITYCNSMAEQCGYGAGAEHFRRAAKETQDEATLVREELLKRGVII